MLQHGFIITWITVLTGSIIRSQAADLGLFPEMFNLAVGADITSNATCGQFGPSHFCKLVEHVKRNMSDTLQCGVCDMHAHDPRDRHLIEYATDGSNNWWQSPTIAGGHKYHWVTITLDLKQVYQVAYVIVKAANSPRPGNWILERSIDGVEYRPWQYFAMSDSECWSLYHIEPTIGIPRFTTEDQVLCTSEYSKLNPLENGEIFTSLVNGRSQNGPSSTLVEFTKARYIRLRLQKIRTLNADLMAFLFNNPENLDSTVTNRYFYSIKDISIGGQCICLGHARQCQPDPVTGVLRCVCEDNTCGSDCQECCPMYHQMPWKPGTYTEGGACERCECFGHATECVYNQTVADLHLSLDIHDQFRGGGVCVDCQHNTMGLNCEMCEDGYFRPRGIARNRTDSCHMCLCDNVGSIGLCVKDDSLEHAGIYAGDCICREGYCGPHCEECSPGYEGYPDCQPCPCSQAGSLNVNVCVGECVCKPMVSGDMCDSCLSGFYNLQPSDPNGCSSCFCFGITSHCQSSLFYSIQLQDLTGWMVTDLSATGFATPTMNEFGHLEITSAQTAHLNRATYWTAPELYLGNKLTSYSGLLSYSFLYHAGANCTDSEAYLANHDVIIEGSNMRLGTHGQYYVEDKLHSVVVNLTETMWQHIEGSTSQAGTLVPREEFMMVLAQVERFLVRASYNVYQFKSVLQCLSFDVGAENGHSLPMPGVEVCTCPEGYAGTSCESCAPGYRRVGNILYGGICERCMCYNHATSCDAITGECLNCMDNTQGMYCEECAFGHYGDAVRGTCQPCACPLVDSANNFADGCVMTPDMDDGYVCIGCQPGYMGRFCEICEPGYYGNPMIPGGSCQKCDCNGNVPGGVCHPMTGACENCLGHTEGAHCERCQLGYYGTAVNGDCHECACNSQGSTSSVCDPITGQCTCAERYTSRTCSRCQSHYGNIRAGCPPCRCNSTGSVNDLCDPVTGQCVCKQGVGGLYCDSCQRRHYLFSADGCRKCLCHIQGATDLDCDKFTGQCNCKSNVTSHTCDQCLPDHWGLNSGQGCRRCMCDNIGSLDEPCDFVTGQCSCRPGVGGRTCDQCKIGYYGFSIDGCLECQECHSLGYVCDSVTGDCVCPPNTEGDTCNSCQIMSWGYHPYEGCKLCSCNVMGSMTRQCDQDSGQCECWPKFTGLTCDRCHDGHYGFPNCQPCGCHAAGTRRCDGKTPCQCDGDGQCDCKINVEGRKCSRCVEGSFGLQAENPAGCTSCFCFTRSTRCTQAQYSWSKVSVADRTVHMRVTSKHDSLRPNAYGQLILTPGISNVSISNSDLNKPIYWQLPVEFSGDMTLSYNGQLSFRTGNVHSTRRNSSSQHSRWPTVILTGNSHLRFSYLGTATPSDGGQHYSVLLREDMWRDTLGEPVSRDFMMVALQNVQQWLVKASDNAHITSASLLDVSIDRAVPSNGSVPTALGIEQCVCPQEYTGLSCQDPADGYYRETPTIRVAEIREPIDIISQSIPCRCHGHSNLCNPQNGVCLNCRHNTAGNQCEFCAPGYYGNATRSTSADCQPCACPTVQDGLTCHMVPGGDFICDTCVQGYTGDKCDSCAPGYYGDPRVGCEPCDCHVDGSHDQLCNAWTGQCSCYAGITGRRCDLCKPRHAVLNGRCISCDEGCTAILMEELDVNDVALHHFNMSAPTLLPWTYLDGVLDRVDAFRDKMKYVSKPSDSHRPIPQLDNIRERSYKLMIRAEEMFRPNLTRHSKDTRDKAKDLVRDVEHLSRNIMTGEGSGLMGGSAADHNIEKAKRILAELNATDFSQQRDKANNELRLANECLLRVHHRDTTAVATNRTRFTRRLHTMRSRFLSFHRILRHVANVTSHVTDKNNVSQQLMDRIRSQSMDPINAMKWASETLREARGLNENSSASLRDIPLSYEMISDLLQLLPDKQRTVQTKVDHLHHSLEGIDGHVRQAEKHARKVKRQSDMLDDVFMDARRSAEDPLRAAKAYEDMTAAILSAGEASDEASAAARNASLKIQAQKRRGMNLRRQVRHTLKNCQKLKARTNRMKGLDRDFAQRLNSSAKAADILERDNDACDRNLHKLFYMLRNFSRDMGGRALDVQEHIAMVSVQTTVTNADTESIHAKIERRMRPKLHKLKRINVEGMKNLTESVSRASRTAHKVVNMTDDLTERMHKLNELRSTTDNVLRKLRESIHLAREQAKNIKISLHCEADDCARRYKAQVKPATANTIRLHFKTNNSLDSMLLFLLNNPHQPDFIAVELISRRVRLTWDTGAGTTSLEHPLLVVAAAGKTSEVQKWYRVEASRIANLGTLSVKRLSSPASAQIVTTSALASHIKLDVDEHSDLFIGGITQDYKAPSAVSSRSFTGCIGDVSMDGKRIGLYNFALLEGSSCRGCSIVPSIRRQSGVYQFDGTGYAEMPSLRYHPQKLSILFKFKTFWKEALLFRISNNATGDEMSVTMRRGHVVFHFSFAGSSSAILESKHTYNTNSWVTVTASRLQHRGQLDIISETGLTESVMEQAPDSHTVSMLLHNNKLYFGGEPRLSTNQTRFLGCIKDVQVASRGSFYQDLMQGVYIGVQAGCVQREVARVVGLFGNGYLEMRASDLEEGDISFAFRTQQLEALLLLAQSAQGQSYYSVSVSSGHLSVWMSSGTADVTLTSAHPYNDAHTHTVSIVKDEHLIELFVDDEFVTSGRMPSTESGIVGLETRSGGLYVGGLPPDVNLFKQVTASLVPFRGCLSDLVINGRQLTFDESQRFANADVGRCVDSHLFTPTVRPVRIVQQRSTPLVPSFTVTITVPPTTTLTAPTTPIPTTGEEPLSCAAKVNYKMLHQASAFGDTKHSHAEVNINKRSIKRDFHISLEFRTFHPQGLLFYITNTHQTESIASYIRDGRIIVAYEGAVESRYFESEADMNNGHWHLLRVKKSKRNMTIGVDNEPAKLNIPRKLDLINNIYVAGLPQALEPRQGLVSDSLIGCIRGFHLNDVPIDLANSKAIMGIRQCFSSVEPGVHFDGWARAVYAEDYHIGSEFRINLQFRTRMEEGVIFSTGEEYRQPVIAVVMHERKLKLTLRTEDVTFTVESASCAFCLCDARWHHVQAEVTEYALSLTVDGQTTSTDMSNAHVKLDTYNYLYIGGYPDFAPPESPMFTEKTFIGCLRSLHFDGVLVDWRQAFRLTDIYLGGCPVDS